MYEYFNEFEYTSRIMNNIYLAFDVIYNMYYACKKYVIS